MKKTLCCIWFNKYLFPKILESYPEKTLISTASNLTVAAAGTGTADKNSNKVIVISN